MYQILDLSRFEGTKQAFGGKDALNTKRQQPFSNHRAQSIYFVTPSRLEKGLERRVEKECTIYGLSTIWEMSDTYLHVSSWYYLENCGAKWSLWDWACWKYINIDFLPNIWGFGYWTQKHNFIISNGKSEMYIEMYIMYNR